MKHTLIMIMLLLTLALSGCSVTPETAQEPAGNQESITPVAQAPDALRTDADIVLFFRYADLPYLAQEQRTVTQLPTQAWEQTLINALISGPETHSARLSSAFPEGTQLIATVREGRTLFVTLSSEIMNPYPDEPANWQSDDFWAQEVPRRRMLCMQSLAATITENSDVDRIQVLVAQPDATSYSYRLPQSYYRTTVSTDPAPLLTRDGAMELTPDNTMRAIADAWLMQDWATLYLLVPAETKLDQHSFTLTMEALPRMIDCAISAGSISADGQSATFTLQATLADGAASRTEYGTVRLTRSGLVWGVTLSQLTGWLEE